VVKGGKVSAKKNRAGKIHSRPFARSPSESLTRERGITLLTRRKEKKNQWRIPSENKTARKERERVSENHGRERVRTPLKERKNGRVYSWRVDKKEEQNKARTRLSTNKQGLEKLRISLTSGKRLAFSHTKRDDPEGRNGSLG